MRQLEAAAAALHQKPILHLQEAVQVAVEEAVEEDLSPVVVAAGEDADVNSPIEINIL